MRKLVQSRETLAFLTTEGIWADDLLKARDFHAWEEARAVRKNFNWAKVTAIVPAVPATAIAASSVLTAAS